jgi:putative alpha-1,2-mannosidase
MSDIVNTYLARYQREGLVNGNICLFTGPTGDHANLRFSPALVVQAYQSGIQADYPKLYAALKNNFDNPDFVPASLSSLGYLTQPPSGGKACSETLEFATGADAMAALASANHDPDGARRFHRLSKAYTNLWDGENLAFRLKNADGSWGVINNSNWTWNPNPQGLFEGTTKDWMFAVPHDPYGLINLPGQAHFTERVIDYCMKDTWFNDYQYHYPFLLYYAGAPNEAQKILRRAWVPMFEQGIMYEGVRPNPTRNGWQTHYTSNAGWLICSMLGLYPISAPAGQFIISSPSVTKAVIHHGSKNITVRAPNNSDKNIYIRSIKVNGKPYPAYMIPVKRLLAGATIDLEMSDDPAADLGQLYFGSSDGFILSAELVSAMRLKGAIAAVTGDTTTRIHSRTKPAKIMVNGQGNDPWAYDEARQTITIQTTGTATVEVWAR